MTIAPLPDLLNFPGLIAGGGINRSVNSIGLQIGELLQANNVSATSSGFSNISGGITKLNTNTVTGIVRGGTVFKGISVFVAGGNIFTMPLNGGTTTLVAAAVFDPNKSISFAAAKGSGEDKLYMCDGVNIPRAWNGSTITAVSAFSSTILSTFSPANGYPDKVTFFQNRLVWSWPASSNYRNYVLFSTFLDADDYAQSIPADATDPFFEEIAPGRGSIAAISSIRQSLQDYQSEVLAVFKEPSETYLSSQIDFGGGIVSTTFNRQALDFGAANQNSVVPFQNSLVVLSKNGIGELASATESGSVNVLTYQLGNRVNPLVKPGGFNYAWSVHCPFLQTIWFSFVKDQSITGSYGGISYPETPNTLTLCLYYGIFNQNGEIYNCWTTREGDGWGFASAWTDGVSIYLGSYFGDVYLWGGTGEYERNPATPTTAQPFTSTIETGDYTYDQSSFSVKNIKHLEELWFAEGSVQSTTCVFRDLKPTGSCITKTASLNSNLAIYGTALYGTGTYAIVGSTYLPRAGFGEFGNYLRIKSSWPSLLGTTSNGASLFGYRGLYNLGNRLAVNRVR